MLRKCPDETRRDDDTNILTMALRPMGIGIMGPFPLGKKQLKFFIVAIDCFTKWVEAAQKGPYKVIRHSREGFYCLKFLDGQELPRPWNIEHLKK